MLCSTSFVYELKVDNKWFLLAWEGLNDGHFTSLDFGQIDSQCLDTNARNLRLSASLHRLKISHAQLDHPSLNLEDYY